MALPRMARLVVGVVGLGMAVSAAAYFGGSSAVLSVLWGAAVAYVFHLLQRRSRVTSSALDSSRGA